MTIRHSKKALMVSAFISLFIFIGFYFIFARYLTKDWDIYIIGFFISLIACFGPFLKELYRHKFNFLEIENGDLKISNLFNKVVIPSDKFADYKIYSGIYEKLLKIYDFEVYTTGGEVYLFKSIDKENNIESLLDEFTKPKEA